jgi:hypothetical protein
MFIKTRVDTINEAQLVRAFVKSLNVQAFPCGRRRSTKIEKDLNDSQATSSVTEYRIPFDPEARLNTEANNRKYSSINGYTQTYLSSWNKDGDNKLSMAIAGYLFNISLPTEYVQEQSFGEEVLQAIVTKYKALDQEFDFKAFIAEHSHIYANIVIQDTKLFSGFQNYYTGVLQSQSPEAEMVVLDLLIEDSDPEQVDNYYFSGLSFSASPLTDEEGVRSEQISRDSRQAIFSLCILERVDGTWKVPEASKLPKVEHGPTEDSVVVGDLYTGGLYITGDASTFSVDAYGDINLKANEELGCAGSIKAESVDTKVYYQNGEPMLVAKIVKLEDEDCWQLQFTSGLKTNTP